MNVEAIHQLIALARRLKPCGEIGDGMVAHFHEVADRAAFSANAVVPVGRLLMIEIASLLHAVEGQAKASEHYACVTPLHVEMVSIANRHGRLARRVDEALVGKGEPLP